MTYGATPEEWAHLDLCLGLTRDLLPVVSDPHARISEQSKMKAVGKTPSRFNGNGDAVGFPEWTQYEAEGKDITRWQRDNRLGVCIQTRRVRALDIDVSDRIPAERIEDAFREATGLDSHLPVRMRDNSGKRLLAFIVEGELPKRKMIVDGGIIELLGNGQQFVACGTHTSGARYTWAGGLPSSLPVLTLDQLDAAWQRLTELFAVEPPTSSTSLRRRGEDLGIVDPVVDYLLAKWETHGEGRDGQVYVTCPWEAEHTSDSGPTASSWIPAGTNGYQQGHYSCLHAHCAGRIDHEFLTAVGYNTADFEPLPEIVLPPSAPFAARGAIVTRRACRCACGCTTGTISGASCRRPSPPVGRASRLWR